MRRWCVFAALALGACTLTHPLDKYGSGGPDGAPEPSDAGLLERADAGSPDAAVPKDATVDEAGCAGDPTILEPTDGQEVGAAIHLRVDAPSCIRTMIVYLNYAEVLRVSGHTIDQWVPVPIGANKLNVNGWAGTATAHPSPIIAFNRKN
jgi:hypothetical protein